MKTTKEQATLLEQLERNGGWKVMLLQIDERIQEHEDVLLRKTGINADWNKPELTMYDVFGEVRKYLVDIKKFPQKVINQHFKDKPQTPAT